MICHSLFLLLLALGADAPEPAGRAAKPAPAPSRYRYSVKIDAKSLPKGVTIREVRDELAPRLFISNASEVPLVIHEKFSGKTMVGGSMLKGGKVYGYFPSGVPMEGKTHLKGWQAPFGDIPETLLYVEPEPAKIYAGRKPGLSRELPPPEPITIPAKLDGKPYEIQGTVHYELNPEYDKFHGLPVPKDE